MREGKDETGDVGGGEVYRFTTTREVFRPDAFTLTDGGSQTLNGKFEALPQKTFAFDYKGSAFSQMLEDAPTQSPDLFMVELSATAEYGAPEPGFGGEASLFEVHMEGQEVWTDQTCNPDSCDPVAITGVKIPEGLLETGKHYYVQVGAAIDERDPAAPYRYTSHLVRAITFTGVLTP